MRGIDLDGLYDVEHKPRLAYARSYFLGYCDRDPDLEGLEKFYVEWRDYNEYIVVQKQSDNLRIEGVQEGAGAERQRGIIFML